jgi:DNA helicase-2/ATP-dependent DNA helicase PcrA
MHFVDGAHQLKLLRARRQRLVLQAGARYAEQLALGNAELPSLGGIYGKESSFMPGIDVVDVTQIKGLEYDDVVVVELGQATFPDQVEGRHLLHIAATSCGSPAVGHQLWVTRVGLPSPLLPDVG